MKESVKVLLAIALFSVGLVALFMWIDARPPSKDAGDAIHYVQDCRTSLCFAYKKGGYHLGMATVPCDKVEHVLNNKCSGLK